jgi:hypothetical protein
MVVEQEGTQADVSDIVDELEKYSIKIGWWQTQQLPANNAPVTDWVYFVLLKVIGLSVTAMAVSQGSSFWYDLLKKMTSPATSTSSSKTSDGGSSSTSSSSSG